MATFLFQMALINCLLLIAMSTSTALPIPAIEAVPVVAAYSRYHTSAENHDDVLTEFSKQTITHRKSNARGVRFDMMRRPSSCAEMPMLDSESRSLHFACALDRSSRRQRFLYQKMSSTNFIRSVTEDRVGFPPEHQLPSLGHNETLPGQTDNESYEFPESAGYGEFLVPIYLGTPPQKAVVIIDTGSDLTWIQSEPCRACFEQADPIFDPSKSSTYNKIACSSSACADLLGTQTCSAAANCIYAYGYGDGSVTRGYFSKETITATDTAGEEVKVDLFEFGASVYNTGTFGDTGGEGILGLGQGPVSMPSQLGSVLGNKFSYCLVDWLSAGSETSTMYFGDAAVPSGEVQYTPIVPNADHPTYYYIAVQGISVGGSLLDIDQSVYEIDSGGSGGTIIDSGTTITYLQQEVFNALVAAYTSQVRYPTTTSATGLDLCFNTRGTGSPVFPAMTIHLDGVHLELPTANTFISLETNIICLAFASALDFPIAIFGNIQQQNFDIVYDLDNMRIGFAPADCASL
uniref:Peptidase A1 domain-containing protein n=1 Tax=Physcomitrium patens TaxID=3218 RepID=A0A2K1KU23_PHYPA|nr:hypothetical protein PHYPA_004265 [Physcomitrium patens]